jgi:NADP-dependent 3-hydroxy acid dehydrogenase YdfG
MSNRVVVITGASAGIGAALAEIVSQRGGQVVLVARREDKLAEVARKCSGETLVVAADVTKRAEVDRARDAALARFGHIDVWVNNAGRGISRSVSELHDSDIDEMVTVNVKSALYGMQTVLAHFGERGSGHIINVSSLLGRVPFAPIRSAYAASKHMLNALTANLRMELKTKMPNVHVTTVSPGVVQTEFGLNSLHGGFDSRSLPNSQTAEEVATVIADVIDKPQADIYTRPGAREMIAGYFGAEDMAAVEAGFGNPIPQRRT